MKKVLVGGRFNKIHPGHLYFFNEAKSLGDMLIVVIAHDTHNNGVSMETRKENVEKTNIPDKVHIGYPDSFVRIVEEEKPDIIALGYDQKLPEDTVKIVKKLNIHVSKIKKHENYSSSSL